MATGPHQDISSDAMSISDTPKAKVATPPFEVVKQHKPQGQWTLHRLTKDFIRRLVKNRSERTFLEYVYLGRRVIKEIYILDEVVGDKYPTQRYHLRIRNENIEAKIEPHKSVP